MKIVPIDDGPQEPDQEIEESATETGELAEDESESNPVLEPKEIPQEEASNDDAKSGAAPEDDGLSKELKKALSSIQAIEGSLVSIASQAPAIESVAASLAELKVMFETRIAHAEHEDKVIDYLHQELSKYRQDLYSRLTRPILADIAEIRDDVRKLVASARTGDGAPVVDADLVDMLAEQLLEVLARNGVEAYRSEPMAKFDPKTMRVAKKVAAPDPGFHGAVIKSIHDGYLVDGARLIPERVEVYD